MSVEIGVGPVCRKDFDVQPSAADLEGARRALRDYDDALVFLDGVDAHAVLPRRRALDGLTRLMSLNVQNEVFFAAACDAISRLGFTVVAAIMRSRIAAWRVFLPPLPPDDEYMNIESTRFATAKSDVTSALAELGPRVKRIGRYGRRIKILVPRASLERAYEILAATCGRQPVELPGGRAWILSEYLAMEREEFWQERAGAGQPDADSASVTNDTASQKDSANGNSERAPAPTPIFRYVGGKTKLLPQLLPLVPSKVGTYFEPFAGGAALFFALVREPKPRFTRAVLGEMNEDIIVCYRAVRDDVDGVIDQLRDLRYDPLDYDAVKVLAPHTLSDAARAARFIYLTRCNMNGVWRVAQGEGNYNVPIGEHKKPPRILREEELRAASGALRGVEVVYGDFEMTLARAREGDFVYADPPYVGGFDEYTQGRFPDAEHVRLAKHTAVAPKRAAVIEARAYLGALDDIGRLVPVARRLIGVYGLADDEAIGLLGDTIDARNMKRVPEHELREVVQIARDLVQSDEEARLEAEAEASLIAEAEMLLELNG